MKLVNVFKFGLPIVGLLTIGCSAPEGDPGLRALLRVSQVQMTAAPATAQFFPGAPPADTDGPAISSFINTSNTIFAGQRGKPLSGIVTPDTGAVALYLDGDRGYWVIIPGAADATALNQLGFSASLSFSPALVPGVYTLTGRAIGIDGKFGPPSTAQLTAQGAPANGTLVVSLAWDVNADLDLHVVEPDGVEIYSQKINSYQPPAPGQPADPNGWMTGGILDFDSNSQCNLDGRRLENVYWTVPPPSGHYLVRVDTYSLCGEALAYWNLAANLDGNVLGLASGVARDSDSALPHGAGAGVLALQFDVP